MNLAEFRQQLQTITGALATMTAQLDDFATQQAAQSAINQSLCEDFAFLESRLALIAAAIDAIPTKTQVHQISSTHHDTHNTTDKCPTQKPPVPAPSTTPSTAPSTALSIAPSTALSTAPSTALSTAPSTTLSTAPSWTTVVRRRKPPVSERTRLATARAFAPPRPSDTTSGYAYVYIPRSRRMDRKDIRQRFHNLGIDTARILDISFPARSVIGVLIHSEYQSEFLELLAASKVKPTEAFNPCAQDHIADPRYNDMSIPQRAQLAADLQQDRCTRTLHFLRPYLVRSVAQYFVQQKWITETMASSILQARVPCPPKRKTIYTSSATTTFLT